MPGAVQNAATAARREPASLREPAAAQSETLRVLMLGPALQVRGGISSVESALIAHLPPHIQVTHVATMVDGSKWGKLRTFVAAFVRAARHLRRVRPDVVHIHFSSRASNVRKMALARLALACGAKLIMHAHSGTYRDYFSRLSPAKQAAALAVLRRADRLIVLGEVWREFFVAAGVRPDRIVVLPNPVVLPGAVPVRRPNRQVSFVYLGLISHAKGAFDLVEAVAASAPECRARVQLVIAGNGAIDELRELIRRRGLEQAVEVRDWVPPAERDRLLAGADAFALPSYAEGLPMALLEAMAWGLPVICTPVGSVPEHVHDGVEGILVQPGDIAQLARAIELIVGDDGLRGRMGARARATAEPLSSDTYAMHVAALYQSVARAREVGA
jgi:glycosyltransferase involved in cell wall biosynthesis